MRPGRHAGEGKKGESDCGMGGGTCLHVHARAHRADDRMTRTGEAVRRTKEEAAHPIRFCTVRCGLSPRRNDREVPRLRHPALQAVFQSVASRIGVYRHVVSLVANQLVLANPDCAACGWKTFYDRTWSAVEAVAAGKAQSNELHAAVADALANTPVALPEKVLFDLRQQETAQLETHTVEHLETFPERLLHALTARVADAAPHLTWAAVEALASRALAYATSCPTQLGAAETALRACGDGADVAFALACAERAALGELVDVVRNGRPFLHQFSKKTIHRLLPHLMRVSEWSERWLTAHHSQSADESTTDDDASVGDVRRWPRSRLPRPCTALPIAQLKAAMVLYCCTEVETLLQNLRRKRGRDEEEASAAGAAVVDKVEFASAIFNMDSFKGRRGLESLDDGTDVPKWRVASFRTDGVALAITFVSGHAPPAFNAATLMQRGYRLAEPPAPVDVGTTRRGLYFVGERRCDAAPATAPVRVAVVDPGFCKPVHVAAVRTDSASPLHDAEHWHVTEEEWMRESGRSRAQAAERRRRDGTAYGRALESLADVGRRKSVTATFAEYVGAMLRTLSVRAAELTSVGRSAARWQQKRCLARFVGRLCDRLFDRTSTRPQKWREATPVEAEAREALRHRLLQLRRQRRETPTVVFFGDASYGPSMRGHNAIPKKGLLRELCHRGLTFLLDEYRTSKTCPCGHDELKTTSGRLRAHKSDGAVCPLLSRLGTTCDRDVLASLNMVSCALCALSGRQRPEHLCRPVCRRCG